jgi:NAD(P)-dependent dehydrogenase (short-subunit alcohol dehydrogenase family)
MNDVNPGAPGGVSGRSALVVGGGRGLGRAVAIALAEGGARVLAVGRTAKPLDELAALARSRRLPLRVARGDAGRAATVRAWIRGSGSRERAPDILVVAAGDYWEGPFSKLTVELWEALLHSNTTVPLAVLQEALPLMRKRRYGRILLFGVAGGEAPRAAARAHAYRAAKVALLTLAKSIAHDEAPNGVTVNVILPGIIRPAFSGREADLIRRIPAGRLGSPREVARAALFLLAEESGYITGAALPVAGGYLL